MYASKNKFKISNEIRIDKNDLYFKKISDGWGKTLKKVLSHYLHLILRNIELFLN